MVRNPFKKIQHSRHVDGILHRTGNHMLLLQSRTIHIEVDRRFVQSFWRRGFIVVVVLVCVVGIGVVFVRESSADVTLNPTICLGGWDNPAKAEGVPDLDGSDYSQYSQGNSASISNSISQIFCGKFTGTIPPPNTAPTKIILHLSWAVARTPVPQVITGDTFASTTGAILDSNGSNNVLVITTGSSTPTSPSPATSSPPESTTPPQDTSQPESVPSLQDTAPPQSDAPQSLISNIANLFAFVFAPRAYAQTKITSLDAGVATSSVAFSTPPATTPDGIVEVLYTLDGDTWNSMAVVPASAFSTASFDISVDTIKSWDDLSKLQIEVRTLSSPDPSTTIYLDGMRIDVAYTDEVSQSPATVLLQNGSVFTETDEPSVVVHPVWNDGTTNIIFFRDYGDSVSYTAETVGRGELPLAAYYAPLPGPGKYVMLEYTNDGGSFGCNGISVAECVHDPHFIARTDFEVIPDATSSDTMPTTP